MIAPPTSLSGTHLRTFETIFRHPVSHNLAWHDVHALFRHLGEVHEEANGNLKVTLLSQTIVLPPPRKKDISEADEVLKLRHFLAHALAPRTAATPAAQAHWLLVINHHAARLFRSTLAGTAAEQILARSAEINTVPATDSKDFSRGGEHPDLKRYFTQLALVLKDAPSLLFFGSGAGNANAMDQFAAWLHVHHADLARRIVSTHIVDEHHLSDAQLLTKARATLALPGEAAFAST
jgi:hypothetical protein